MPFPFEFLDGDRGVYEAGIGHVTGAEVLAANRAILAGAQTRKLVYTLVDLSQATALAFTPTDLFTLVQIHRQLALSMPNAVVAVVARTNLHFGVARMWEGWVHRMGWITQVFRTRDEAEHWLRSELHARAGFEPTFK
jgi:hypothetical protein